MPRPLPPLPSAYRSLIWTDAWAALVPEHTTLSALNQQPVEHHDARFVDVVSQQSPSQMQARIDDPSDMDALLAEVDALVAERAPPMRAGSTQMMPVMDPAHNYREISKQLLLLEDHLFHPKKECPDCIRKHLLTAEALAEEAVSLDKARVYGPIHQWLPDQLRDFQADVIRGASAPDIAQKVRGVRKRLSRLSFDTVMHNRGPEQGSRAAAVTRKERRASKIGVVSSEKKPLEILAEREAVARRNPFAQNLGGGEPVVYGYRAEPGKGVQAWHEGRVALPGDSKCGPKDDEVTSIPQDGWIAVDAKEGGCVWVYPSELMPLVTDKVGRPRRLSTVFEPFGKIRLYVPEKPGAAAYLTPERLAMIDLIYAVLSRKLVGALPAVAIESVAKAAVINAAYESALDPAAVGDGGLSVGLFQLNERGAGSGMSKEQRQNPIDNAVRISDEFLRRLDQTTDNRKCPPVQQKLVVLARRARAAQTLEQMPTVAEWTAAFASQVECPASATAPARRARTATELFGGAALVVPSAVFVRKRRDLLPALPAAPPVTDDTKKMLVYAAGASVVAALVTAVVLGRDR